ncbi:unnamed protein product, partial [marine sediment metagenome]
GYTDETWVAFDENCLGQSIMENLVHNAWFPGTDTAVA